MSELRDFKKREFKYKLSKRNAKRRSKLLERLCERESGK